MQPQPATLVRIIQHPTDWYDDLRRDQEFIFRKDDGTEESVSEYFMPQDCRRIGDHVFLEYRCFTLGNAQGYHFEPRRMSLYEEWIDPRTKKIRELYGEYEKKLQAMDDGIIPFEVSHEK